jgi:cytochrome o ubiquinol oxidase subunit 1
MVIGGFLFGFFAAFTYWFPKFTGFFLSERLNKYAFWCWFGGFLLAFMPLYMLGFMGATRRLDRYEAATGWHPLFVVVAFGALIILCGGAVQLYGLYKSIQGRDKNPPANNDPWNGRTLEWSIPSPPPYYNFAVLPIVDQLDPLWAIKSGQAVPPLKEYTDIHLPANTPVGFYIGALSAILGFAMTWHIFWLALLATVAIMALMIVRLSGEAPHEVISAAKVKELDVTYSKRYLSA